MLTVKKFREIFCILFVCKHTKNIINFIHGNLSLAKYLQPFLFRDSSGTNWLGQYLREIQLIPHQSENIKKQEKDSVTYFLLLPQTRNIIDQLMKT